MSILSVIFLDPPITRLLARPVTSPLKMNAFLLLLTALRDLGASYTTHSLTPTALCLGDFQHFQSRGPIRRQKVTKRNLYAYSSG